MLEACIDAAHHVCATSGYGPVDTNAGAMVLLAANGVIARDSGVALAQAVRFRNLLVHGYADIDDLRVVAFLQHLGDIDAYVASLTALL